MRSKIVTADEAIALIAAAQQPDGYLSTMPIVSPRLSTLGFTFSLILIFSPTKLCINNTIILI